MNAHKRIHLGSFSPPAIRFALLWALLLIGLPAGTSAAVELSTQMRESLAPLAELPVQDYGFVRSGYSFGENHLTAITGRHTYEDLNGLETVVWLIADPAARRSTPLLKLDRPELVELFKARRISLEQYRAEASRERLMDLINKDQQLWLEPINRLEGKAQHLEQLEAEFAFIPRPGEWQSPAKLHHHDTLTAGEQQAVAQWQQLIAAVQNDQPEAAAAAASALKSSVHTLAAEQRADLPRLELDSLYHRHRPFSKASIFYLGSALAFGGGLMFNRRRMAHLGLLLLGVGFAEQVFGTTLRWMLAERAPLSNMYESFTFAIGGMVGFGFAFEWKQKMKVAGLGAAVLGFIFMVLAHNAPIFDAQIRPLMPALQSSWLTYHVVTIMLSYSAFALAFFVSLCYLLKTSPRIDGLLGRWLPRAEALDMANYRIIAVGFPLLTIGIIFGAIWADTAWGRPWGFDPKETWSAITWLIYAIYLHVRYLAGWRGRPAAWMAMLGFLAVLFTYFGVNYLLPGLHSYA